MLFFLLPGLLYDGLAVLGTDNTGLKSLKKRIAQGQLVIAQTDMSKRFAVMTRQQFLESGLQHTAKDLEIDPDRVKRIQNTVNSHVEWLKDMSNIGKH